MIELETYLDSAKVALAAGLPAKLAAIDTALNLTGPDKLPVPDEQDYYVGVVKLPLRYPLIEVAVADWNMTDFDIEKLAATGEFPLLISATLRSADKSTDKLYRMLLRYSRAILNVVLDPLAWPSGGVVTSVRGAYRMNPEQRRDAMEVTGATVLGFGMETSDSREL